MRFLEGRIILDIFVTGFQWILAFHNIRNLWVLHYSTIIELSFIVVIYSYWIRQKPYQLILRLCLAGFFILWIISKFTFEPLSLSDGGTATISKILQIFFSAYLFVIVIKDSEIIWTNDPRFWIAASIIINAAGNLFLSALFNKMLQISPERLIQVYSLTWVLGIFVSSLMIRGFLCKK
ncbi:MAG: hypothetical protein EHM64_07090 [Ignavibacteriae bacterium]|nr:MAG: hypothetical protein EHM64_07090 [Ignavibacteriota bacterium]